MAGDWLKIEANTPEKEEVLAITATLGWDDPDTTVGKLFRLWRWFDQQTTNGNAPRVTSALLDRVVGVSGFCKALESVGWLILDGDGVTLPKFDRHNGKSAKTRAQTAKRVAVHKGSNDKGNAAGVSSALPREEKRRVIPQSPADAVGRFQKFWSAYPKKIGKDAALKAFEKRKPDDALTESMVKAVQLQAAGAAWTKDGGQFIPNPATWLNQGRWMDEEHSPQAGLQLVGGV